MTGWEEVRRQVAVSGRVTDARTGRPIAGADVALDATGRARTAPDGHFHFLDLADGAYTLSASLPSGGSRYGSATVGAAVARDPDGRVAMAVVELPLPSTAVSGRVTDGGTGVGLATVAVRGSGERTLTDRDGRYLLSGLETGLRRVTVTVPGRPPLTRAAPLDEAGSHHVVDFAIDSDQPP